MARAEDEDGVREGRCTRLKKAREAAGFRSARAAALRHSWAKPTYRAHESGNRTLTLEAVKRYGPAFGVDPAYIWGEPLPAIDLSKPKFRLIEIDFDVWQRIQAERRGFADTNNNALRRLLGID